MLIKSTNVPNGASKNLDNVSASEVLIDAKIKLYDKVTTVEIDKSLIMSARSKIEFEPNYAYMGCKNAS